MKHSGGSEEVLLLCRKNIKFSPDSVHELSLFSERQWDLAQTQQVLLIC